MFTPNMMTVLSSQELSPETKLWEKSLRWLSWLGIGIGAIIAGVTAIPSCGASIGVFIGATTITIGAIAIVVGINEMIYYYSDYNLIRYGTGWSESTYDKWVKKVMLTAEIMTLVCGIYNIIQMLRGLQCFKAGTLVKTKEGDKKIEDIEVGDLVWAYDEETGECDWKPVVRLFRNESYTSTTIKIEADDGTIDEIVSTPGHMFYLPENKELRETRQRVEHADYIKLSEKWVSAGLLKSGDKILLSKVDPLTGKQNYGIVISVKTEHLSEAYATYNLEISEFHTYYVGKNGACVHNSGPCNLDPKDIHYTQDSINNSFGKNTPYAGQSVDDLIIALKNGTITPDDIPALRVLRVKVKFIQWTTEDCLYIKWLALKVCRFIGLLDGS